MKVVRSRLKYALIAGGISTVLFIAFGLMQNGNGTVEAAAVDATYAETATPSLISFAFSSSNSALA